MSEFFKALEQAERDRRLREGSDRKDDSVPGRVQERVGSASSARAATPLAAERPTLAATGRSWARTFEERWGSTSLKLSRPARRRGAPPALIMDVAPQSVAAEAFRTLRVNIEFMPFERSCRNVVITSPSLGEGKSTAAANLAVVSAQAGWRVCLVDADLRGPILHGVFGLANRGGLTKALAHGLPLTAVAQPTHVPNLSLVVAGADDPGKHADPFTSHRLQQVLRKADLPYDLVLYDTPPVIVVADAVNLAAQCDGVILVVRSGAVPPGVLRRVVRQIGQVDGRILGVLLNGVDLRRDAESYRYYRGYYKREDDAPS